MHRLSDIQFRGFDWTIGLDGDLAFVDGRESFRGLVHRWLLTQPAEDPAGIISEEVERRRLFEDLAARKAGYDVPAGERLTACLPGDPTWGAGIKRYLSAPMTVERLAEIQLIIRDGLARLDGVLSSPAPEVECSVSGRTLTVAWKIVVEAGIIDDVTEIDL